MGMKKGKKIQINVSNKSFYTFLLVSVVLLLAVGVNAWDPAGTGNPGHNINSVAAPSPCSSGQYIRYINSGSNDYWDCETVTQGTTLPSCSSGQGLYWTGSTWACKTFGANLPSCSSGQGIYWTGSSWACRDYVQGYTEMNDVIMFSLRWTGSTFTVENTRVLYTDTLSHVDDSVTFVSYERGTHSSYELRVHFNNYYIDSDEVISAEYIADSNGVLKLSMQDADGDNRIEFVISDDASANNLIAGDEIKFIVGWPTVN